jgi:hypothetical protein
MFDVRRSSLLCVSINMKRSIPAVIRGLALTSLLLVLSAWLRSYWSIDALHWTDGQHFVSVLSSGGRVNVTETDWGGKTAWETGWSASSTSRWDVARLPMWETDPDIYGRHRFLGFEWSNNLSPWPSKETVFVSFDLPSYRLIAVPYWAVTVLCALPWVRLIVRSQRRRSRLRRGCCPVCAYDLRGTPAGCPECGWSPAPAAVSSPDPSVAAPIVPM